MTADTSGSVARTPLSPEDARRRQVRILDAVVQHCEAQDLRVYLAFGTLLGAVRHQGFIPWDDDIDVAMPRPDFERFCDTFAGRVPMVSLRAPGRTPGHPLPFAKVCDDETELDNESDLIRDLGVFIDVFPLDGWRDNDVARAVQRWALTALDQVFRAKHLSLRRRRPGARNLVLRVAKALAALIPTGWLVASTTRVGRWGGFDRCARGGGLVWGYRESVPREAFGEARPLEFEGVRFPGPADPDTVLRSVYGDYWQLPPEHQRVTHHRFTAYLVES